MKKKILIAAMVIVMAAVLCLSGCAGSSAKTPEDVTTIVLNAIKNGDTKTLEKYYDGNVSDFDREKLFSQIAGSNEIPDEIKKEIAKMADKIFDFDANIKDTNMKDDSHAVVTAEIKTYDYSKLAEEVIKNVLSEIDLGSLISGALYGDDMSPEMMADIYKAYSKSMSSLKDKTVSYDVDIDVKKDTEGNWKVQELSDSLTQAVLGNFTSAFSEAFEGILENMDYGSLFDIFD